MLRKATATRDMLLEPAWTTAYYRRIRPHVCSFWENVREERSVHTDTRSPDPDDPLADQNIEDRYYGISASTRLSPHCVGGLGDTITETDLRDHIYQFGEIWTVTVVQRQQWAFIQCATRQAAEGAAEKSFNQLIVDGRRLNVKWGRSQAARGKGKEKDGTADSGIKLEPVPGLPLALLPPPAAAETSANYFNLPSPPHPPPSPPPPVALRLW
ncbi:LOW QUALITY PROTEIN: hypothetical protein QTO34_002152 [Cnephaeus nilssonii]|uniref:RRM domain-containing protein n=1 Tax=Cnephaeus nilssonii TaxID=3371016 RepID=A0AA40HV33_CNENI|nr:LOW QUALITY PROTEIN: hypothetical protein QTO34_002152 [Eptesicus nilssonii]